MPLTHDGKHYIINALSEFTGCGQWLRSKFGSYPYVIVSAKEGKDRTIEQNDKMWPMLTDISGQVVWFGKKHSPEEWKEIITGSMKQGQFVPGIEGGFVVIGMSTSKMNRQLFSALIEYMYAFGADKEVKWSEKSEALYQECKQSEAA